MKIKLFNKTKKESKSKYDLLSELIKEVSEAQTDLCYFQLDDLNVEDKEYVKSKQQEIEFKNHIIEKLLL